MSKSHRRSFLQALAFSSTAVASINAQSSVALKSQAKLAVPVLHVTDLYRPHADPDDHWDLACVYALAHQRAIGLDLEIPAKIAHTESLTSSTGTVETLVLPPV